MAVESIGQALGTAIGEGLAAGLAAAFLLVLWIIIAIVAAAITFFVIGLRERPRTTLATYSFAVIGLLLGSMLNFLPTVILTAITGYVVGRWRFKADRVAVFRGRYYTLFTQLVSVASLIIGIGLFLGFIGIFGPYLLDSVGTTMIIVFILLAPVSAGVYGLAGDRIRVLVARIAQRF